MERGPPPSSPRRQLLRLWLTALVVAGLGGAAWYLLAHEQPEETQLVLQGNIDVRQVNLSFKVDGRIETLMVDEGDTLKAGQVIASLDKRHFRDQLRRPRSARDH